MLTKMKLLAAAGAVAIANVAIPAIAAPIYLNVSGVAGTAGAYTGKLNLDVTNGTVTSATGMLSIAGLTNASLALITTATPGNINDGSGFPVGFRANDGTDYFEADQNYPTDFGGLLFAVGTSTATSGQNPLINFFANGGVNGVAFTGNVSGTEYYNQGGSLNITTGSNPISAVPEPATWLSMILGFGVVGLAMRLAMRTSERKFTARMRDFSALA